MREGGTEHRRHRDHRGEEGRHKELPEQRFHSAQTFRRGRALAFLEKLNVKRSTLLRQLAQPELESIRPVISGELKAVDAIIQEFIHTFELREAVEGETPND
ncbi:hypothetical protein [Paenibacillus glufosinatiresistens]|uniref:hypothetical protein n=1 Tax=Paenibacillus glufosinatiresistens TaxID=3070657 RepID=UPI00286DC2B6|nr:hypothetical protein [Paenibacillus sp. YX.27]